MSLSSIGSSAPARHLVCLDLLQPKLGDNDDGLIGNSGRRIQNCRRLLVYGRTMGWAITHVYDHTARSRHARAIPGLEPLQIEPVIYRTGVSAFSNRMFRENVERTLDVELATNPRLVVFGEDVGPKGGVHGATLGLQQKYGVALILLGLSLSPTCLATALAARDRGVAVALVEDVVAGSPGVAAGIGAIQTLSHSIAAPFVKITRTDELIDSRRGLRVVSRS